MRYNRKKWKGSMTVEAVFVVSLILLVILWLMTAAIDLYGQTLETARLNWLDPERAASTFRKIFFLKEMMP